jgi:hypothetical protein
MAAFCQWVGDNYLLPLALCPSLIDTIQAPPWPGSRRRRSCCSKQSGPGLAQRAAAGCLAARALVSGTRTRVRGEGTRAAGAPCRPWLGTTGTKRGPDLAAIRSACPCHMKAAQRSPWGCWLRWRPHSHRAPHLATRPASRGEMQKQISKKTKKELSSELGASTKCLALARR